MSEQRAVSRFPYFEALYLAFFSRPFYRNVALHARGFLLGYLLFMIALLWIPQMMSIKSELGDIFAKDAPHYVRQVPEITIKDGRASIKEPVPYMIYREDGKTPFAVIDTSAQRAPAPGAAYIVVTATDLFIHKNDTGYWGFKLKDFGSDATVNRRVIYEWLDAFQSTVPILLYPFVVVFTFLMYIGLAMLTALLGGTMAKRIGLALDLRGLVRLAVVSYTPALILQAAHAILEIPFPYSLPVSFAVSIGYMYYGVLACAEKIVGSEG